MRLTGMEDLRVQKTIETINSTFAAMMLGDEYSNITVTALCKRAKINKKTFYRYYETLDYLLLSCFENVGSDYLELIDAYKVPEDIEKINRCFFEYSAKQGALYEKIVCAASFDVMMKSTLQKVINEKWQNFAFYKNNSREVQHLINTFLLHTGLEIYRQWVRDGKLVSLEEVIGLSNKLLTQGISGFYSKSDSK